MFSFNVFKLLFTLHLKLSIRICASTLFSFLYFTFKCFMPQLRLYVLLRCDDGLAVEFLV